MIGTRIRDAFEAEGYEPCVEAKKYLRELDEKDAEWCLSHRATIIANVVSNAGRSRGEWYDGTTRERYTWMRETINRVIDTCGK